MGKKKYGIYISPLVVLVNKIKNSERFEETKNILQEYGIELTDDNTGKIKSTFDVLQQIALAWDDMGGDLCEHWFGN